jgi:hypothetical protein
MNLSKYVDPARCLQLVLGVAGIYVSYLVTGVIHESMSLSPYLGLRKLTRTTSHISKNSSNGLQDS